MTITLEITPELQAELARRAAAHGSAVEAYAATLLEEAVRAREAVFDKARALAAAARIRQLRKGVTLGGLSIRELINEGRR
jgi:plasmid stability protein